MIVVNINIIAGYFMLIKRFLACLVFFFNEQGGNDDHKLEITYT